MPFSNRRGKESFSDKLGWICDWWISVPSCVDAHQSVGILPSPPPSYPPILT